MHPTGEALKIGIVGGGVAGLYAALLLRNAGHVVHIFEASKRLGGRIYTHRFSAEANQYFEAGAMRIPNSHFQRIFLNLISYLNSHTALPSDRHVRLIPYILKNRGNFLYINGVFGGGLDVMDATPADINWSVPEAYRNTTAGSLLAGIIRPFIDGLMDNFARAFEDLLQYDNYSFRHYLQSVEGWDESVIDFVETVCSQTNQFSLSFVELVMQSIDFMTEEWFTIDGGMDRLPQAMGHLVGLNNISFGTRVTGINVSKAKGVQVTTECFSHISHASFDKIILAVPPAVLKMISDRPRWSPEKEVAIRSMHFEPLYKMGIRFKTRFWERSSVPAFGGQSVTDLPIRWIVYPSNGIGEDGPGVLLLYSWMTDAHVWTSLPAEERVNLSLRCLQEVYCDINIHDQVMETFDVVWSEKSATGDAMFLPGQFKQRFDAARKSEGNVYFAGEHLSYHHTWISGALLSALHTVQEIVGGDRIMQLGSESELCTKLRGQ